MTCPEPTNPNPSSHNMQYGPWSSPYPPTINRRRRPITIICYYVTCDHIASLCLDSSSIFYRVRPRSRLREVTKKKDKRSEPYP